MELVFYFLFLQEQIKDIIIINEFQHGKSEIQDLLTKKRQHLLFRAVHAHPRLYERKSMALSVAQSRVTVCQDGSR